jgi:hypothetical protein
MRTSNEPSTVASALTRRHLLEGAAILGAGLVAAACGSTSTTGAVSSTSIGVPLATDSPTGTTGPLSTAPTAESSTPPTGSAELTIAKLAAGLEVLATGTYRTALDAADAGGLGVVPPAVVEFLTVAMQHHQAHLDAWNAEIAGSGGHAVSEPNAALQTKVDAVLAGVTDVAGAATLALFLEETAAATYLNAQRVLTDPDAIALAGSIQIVDAQHAAILHFVLGEYPVPAVFATTELAAA